MKIIFCKILKAVFLLLISATWSFSQSSFGQQQIAQSLGKSIMPIGAYFYPEHWDESEWAPDLKRMADLGFEFTHLGEFAWAMMEPEEGRYEFEWLDKVVELAEKNGLKVIMCTPTPTPPAWLTSKHPEILAVDKNLNRQQHGGRLHAIYNHPTYLKYSEKIIRKLAERYGNHPNVAGWQLDNEPHFGQIYDYSEQATKEFPIWLKSKYRSIDRLNNAWGTAFWSQVYNSFDQIPLPNPGITPQSVNPHSMLDFSRFTADRLADALRFQAELLRVLVSEDQWITTNYAYFKFLPVTNPFLNKGDLDFASHTMYLTSGALNDEGGPLAHRLGSGMELSFSAELAKSVNGRTGIMELQPGQINWGVINPQPQPGAVSMWVWHTFALGDMFTCTYRFKQPLFGSEQTHKGIMDTDGVSVARGGKEYIQSIEEISQLKKKDSTIPAEVKSRNTAFLWNMDNLIDIENHRHHADFDAWQFNYLYYNNLKRMGAPVTFLQATDEFDQEQHPFMVAAAYQITSKELIEKWTRYVEGGGNLILTLRTAKKDPNGHLWKAHNQEPIWDLIGAEIPEFDHLPEAYPGQVNFEGTNYTWYKWGDWLKPKKSTEVLAQYQDQFYQGTAAVVRRELGKGSVTYIGVYTNDGELERKVMRKVFEENGAQILDLPHYVFTEWRDGYWVTVNYSSKDALAPIPDSARIIYGKRRVEPGGATVWE
jgi:beta-galactosidase